MGLLLLSGICGLRAGALEQVASVTSEGIDCRRAIINVMEDGHCTIEFYVGGYNRFNSYRVAAGNRTLDATLTNSPSWMALWLIVLDISDEHGRSISIRNEKLAAARLCAMMSKESHVSIGVLGREYRQIADEVSNAAQLQLGCGHDVELGRLIPVRGKAPVFEWSRSHQGFAGLFDEADTLRGFSANTNLWLGVRNAIKETFNREDAFRHLPKGLVLLSDGMDESNGGRANLQDLIDDCNRSEITVFTIAYPHKDNNANNPTSAQQGFSNLQELALKTGGTHLDGSSVPPGSNAESVQFRDLLNKCSISPFLVELNLTEGENSTAFNDAPPLSVTLRQGNKAISRMTINRNDIAIPYGNYILHRLYTLRQQINNTAAGDSNLEQLGLKLVRNLSILLDLPARDEMFSKTDVDVRFAERCLQVLQHIEANPSLRNADHCLPEAAACLVNYDAALPEPPSDQDASPAPSVVNNYVNTASGVGSSDGVSSSADEDVLQDWVWWSLGLGGSALAILFFWGIGRLVAPSSRMGDANTPGEQSPNNIPDGPTLPVIASLINTANPSQSWVICKNTCTVGRSRSNDICLPYPYISSLQFVLNRKNGRWNIQNLSRVNISMVNGKKIDTAELQSGDVIRIADFEIEFKIR